MKKPIPVITAAVEGDVDEAVIRRLVVDHCMAEVGNVHGKNGKDDLRRNISAYNNAARHAPWLVLVDLDNEAECAPPMRTSWISSPTSGMCFRIAVHAIEAWLLADREAIAGFLSVGLMKVPQNPEEIDNPKRKMVELARQSRKREIREDMVPRPGSGRTVGPAYSSRMVEYANIAWRPPTAARSSESLRRCMVRLKEVIAR